MFKRVQIQTPASRRGAVLVLAALLMVFLMVMVAFAVDIGNLCAINTEAQAAADAAALAAARGLPSGSAQVLANAQACAKLMSVNGQSVALQSPDVVIGTWNTTTLTFTAGGTPANAVQVTVNLSKARGNPVNLFFGPVIGDSTQNVTATSIAAGKRYDVVFVEDLTESYGGDISYAVTGDQALLSALNTYGSPLSNIGLVTFTGWGQGVTPLEPIGTNYTSLYNTIGTWTTCGNNGMPVCSGTNIGVGLNQALTYFTSSSYLANATNVGKAVVLSTDGQPNANSKGENETSSTTDAELLTLATTAANNLWAQNINIFVVYYNHTTGSGDGGDAGATTDASLTRGVGTFVQTTDPTQLPTLLQNLIQSMPYALVK